MTLVAGTRLGPYEILAPLGAGGMGEVYRARDKKLDRDVAIKVLPQSVASEPDTLARFEREAKAVAALSHPNILSIFDFGTQDGVSYAVMELLEGETLRGRLDTGSIPQKQAVDYALQVAKGLSAAHEKGIVHRDLKPENLFITKDGHLKILDFGLAKKVEAVAPGKETSAPTGSGHTEPGVVMGTAGYMSPEQVKGVQVDHRSDIFSFGAILYELLSGKKAFKRDTNAETMAAILTQEPPELSESGRNISPALDHIVKHCLEKDREHRFQSARDIAFNLSEQSASSVVSGASSAQLAAPPTRKSKVVIAVAAMVVLAAAGVFLLRRPHRGGGEAGGVKRVAVLPFENLGAPEDDYFADGIADAVRGKLTSLPGVLVIARSSSTLYKKTTKTPRQVAQELEVGYLLTATVRWQKGTGAASRVEVSPELVEIPGSGAPTSKWQQPFDAALTDVFQVQSDIASRVAQALGLALGATEGKRLSEKPTQNLAAYDAFLKGEEASKAMGVNDPPSLRKALGFYEKAVALDPSFAEGWAQISRACSLLHNYGAPTPDLAQRARQGAERAVAIAPERPEGYLARGDYEFLVGNGNALEQYTKAQRLAPTNADALVGIARNQTQLDASVERFREAERLDPRSVRVLYLFGRTLAFSRRDAQAREVLDRGLALAPDHLGMIGVRVVTFLAEGDLAGARATVAAASKVVEPTALVAYMATYGDLVWVLDAEQTELLLRLTPSAFDGNGAAWGICLAQANALKGDAPNLRLHAEAARRGSEELLRAAPDDAQLHAFLGLALAYLGEKQAAMREGERAVEIWPRNGYVKHLLARIYTVVGESGRALDQLELAVKIARYYVTPAWLKIDPNFDPLRKNPRFQKLVASAK